MPSALAALNRFGLGARPGEAASIRDPQAWLLAQLEGPVPARAHPAGTTPAEVRAAMAAVLRAGARDDREAVLSARRVTARIGATEAADVIGRWIATDRPFVERWIAFWQNHLCISTRAKQSLPPLAGGYERDVIRAHAFGRFDEMLLASARHPAMLIYLDNAGSIGPRSPVGIRGRRGLNENYARELLELHTLGVDGGYTQQDVTELARLLTGWATQNRNRTAPTFAFVQNRHEPGRKTLLGTSYGEGEAEGVRAIRRLAAHPSTARHLGRKLAQHFVRDEPSPALIEALAEAFSRSDGDLKAVARALVTHPDTWVADARKFRTPQDWVVAAFRAVELRGAAPNLVVALQRLRQPLWSPQAPKGYGDLEREWSDPDSLLNRAEFARTMARRWRPNAAGLAAARDVIAPEPLLVEMLRDGGIPISDRAALLLASPSFQWRG